MFIVATAGHIDHGKTALVRALTGVDTDRLPQERARGISIDLGFAYWESTAGELVAFVDVPGHHRFIRNMLAGVAAIDFAMLVVALDDGPMPQTLEHLQILDQLNVRRGVVVLTKADTVGEQRVREVRESFAAMLRATTLEGIPTIVVSSRTGAGISDLKALLAQRAREHEVAGQSREHSRRTRFAVDRVFTVKGAGTVVTGTVFDGQVAREDRLFAHPGGEPLRVRSIQVHGCEVARAGSGVRAAINLVGSAAAGFARGGWLTDRDMGAADGLLLDVRLSLLPQAPPLRHASRARLYLGATEVTCGLLLPSGGQLRPGASAYARLHLDKPLLAINGDRFVLRDGTVSATLGGGIVVDPSPVSRRCWLTDGEFRALEQGSVEAALAELLATSGGNGVSLARFGRIFHLTDARRDAAIAACDAVALGKSRQVIVTHAQADACTRRVAEILQQDTRAAVPLAILRVSAAPGLSADAFEFLLREAAERLDISLAAGAVSLRSRRESVRNADQAAWERVRPLLGQAGIAPPALATLSAASGIPAARLRAILYAQSRQGEVFQLRRDYYIVREFAAKLAAAAVKTAQDQAEGRFTAAQFRDQIGTGRTLAIHALEMLDVIGITRRNGDERTIARKPEAVLGNAEPYRLRPI